ncbi:MAG: HNH endonuclease [Chloroflexi bacterium]|nr:HNH endonuclease [Chloroflexota bacterium]
MARKKSVRPEFIAAAIFIGFIVFGLVSSWWKTHSAIGWAIIVLLLATLSFLLYKKPEFRRWVLQKSKITTEKIVYEVGEPPREQVPARIYRAVISRARGRCENPECNSKVKPVIHHIDRNNKNSSDMRNLIALCPNCHSNVHNKNKFEFSQLRQFVQISYNRQKKPEGA